MGAQLGAVPASPNSANEPAPLSSDTWSFAALIFAAQMLVVGLVIAGLGVAAYQQRVRTVLDVSKSTVAALSTTLAKDPFVAQSLQGPDPSSVLQPYTQDILSAGQDIDFITIMDTRGIRVTHPDPQQIGRHYVGSMAQARAGQT